MYTDMNAPTHNIHIWKKLFGRWYQNPYQSQSIEHARIKGISGLSSRLCCLANRSCFPYMARGVGMLSQLTLCHPLLPPNAKKKKKKKGIQSTEVF